MAFNINNRRYTGSKTKLSKWIKSLLIKKCPNSISFCDIFAGTAVVTDTVYDIYDRLIINDFLYSNEVIYNAFFSSSPFKESTLLQYQNKYRKLITEKIKPNYVSENFGNKYFSEEDALIIGEIRQDIEDNKNKLTKREYEILLASLVYSFDRSANTVGHYEAFIKKPNIRNSFNFELIAPVNTLNNRKQVQIYREDANALARKVKADIVYVDPPYSSRQYSRFYHVIETIVKWDNPTLYGEARKPEPENISEYCKVKAVDVFNELILTLKCKYIAVSYNNTYGSKSKSSENKMTLEQIKRVLEKRGKVEIFTTKHKPFNAGKTELSNHMEYLFIVKVGKEND